MMLSSVASEEVEYVRDVTIKRTKAFRSYPDSINRSASASINSGFDGGLVTRMSSSGSTSPRPMKCFQYRLASDFAKNRLSGDVIQSLSACRGSTVVSTFSTSASRPAGATDFPVLGCFADGGATRVTNETSAPCDFLVTVEKNADNRA